MSGAVTTSRRFVLLAGVASAIVGGIGLAYALFGPTYSSVTCTTDAVCSAVEHHSLLDEGVEPRTWIYFTLVALVVIGVAITALAYHQKARFGTRSALWMLSGILLFLSWLGTFTVGLFFLPAVLFSLLAAAMARR